MTIRYSSSKNQECGFENAEFCKRLQAKLFFHFKECVNQFWDMMVKVGDIFTALPFSNSVLEALKLVAAAAMTFLDVEAVHLNFLLNCMKCGASLVVYLDTSKLVLIFLWHTAMNALAQPFQCIFGGVI